MTLSHLPSLSRIPSQKVIDTSVLDREDYFGTKLGGWGSAHRLSIKQPLTEGNATPRTLPSVKVNTTALSADRPVLLRAAGEKGPGDEPAFLGVLLKAPPKPAFVPLRTSAFDQQLLTGISGLR